MTTDSGNYSRHCKTKKHLRKVNNENKVTIQNHKNHAKSTTKKKKKRIYDCEYCGKILSRLDSLKRHIKIYHEKKTTKKSKSMCLASSSQPVAENKCKYCGCVYTRASNLTNHIKTCVEKEEMEEIEKEIEEIEKEMEEMMRETEMMKKEFERERELLKTKIAYEIELKEMEKQQKYEHQANAKYFKSLCDERFATCDE